MALSDKRATELRQRAAWGDEPDPIGAKGVRTGRPLWNELEVRHAQPLWGQRKDGKALTADKVYPQKPDPYDKPYVNGPVSRLGGVAKPDPRWKGK
jgi:hypothetical protein